MSQNLSLQFTNSAFNWFHFRLSQFVEDLRTGGIKPYMKSAPVPKKQTGNVKHVVADNYDVEIHKVI